MQSHASVCTAIFRLLITSIFVTDALSGLKQSHRSSIPDMGNEAPDLSTNMLDRIIIVPELKLMFCYIEKVGCKNFNDLFRYYRSRFDPVQGDEHTWKRNTFEVHNFSKRDIERAMRSKDWFKAVFYREPIERYVAAWSSKCGGADKDGWKHCYEQFGSNDTVFEETVNDVYLFDVEAEKRALRHEEQVNWTSFDPHWQRQADFCGGLWKNLKFYDMVEKLDRETSRDKVIKLLDKVDVDPMTIPHFNELFPPKGDMQWQGNGHNTDTEDKLFSFFPHDKPWLVETLLRHYSADYVLFDMPPPDWALNAVQDELPWQLSRFQKSNHTVPRHERLAPDMVPAELQRNSSDEVDPSGMDSSKSLEVVHTPASEADGEQASKNDGSSYTSVVVEREFSEDNSASFTMEENTTAASPNVVADREFLVRRVEDSEDNCANSTTEEDVTATSPEDNSANSTMEENATAAGPEGDSANSTMEQHTIATSP